MTGARPRLQRAQARQWASSALHADRCHRVYSLDGGSSVMPSGNGAPISSRIRPTPSFLHQLFPCASRAIVNSDRMISNSADASTMSSPGSARASLFLASPCRANRAQADKVAQQTHSGNDDETLRRAVAAHRQGHIQSQAAFYAVNHGRRA